MGTDTMEHRNMQRSFAEQTPRLIALDIETATLRTDKSFEGTRDLGITCAVITFEDDSPEIHSARDEAGRFTGRMTTGQAGHLLKRLTQLTSDLARPAVLHTWNGTAFDLLVIGQEARDLPTAAALARVHTDMMLHMFHLTGYPIGLATVADAMEGTRKNKDISGSDAPAMWERGEQQQVIDYCLQDTQATLEVALRTTAEGQVCWTAKSGRAQRLPLPNGWNNVSDCLRMPQPDNFWMNTPLHRSEFTGWLGRYAETGGNRL